MKRDFEAVKRIVIKIGTSSLVLPNGKINLAKSTNWPLSFPAWSERAKKLLLVSSGAMGFGLNVLNMEKNVRRIWRSNKLFPASAKWPDEPYSPDFFPIIG